MLGSEVVFVMKKIIFTILILPIIVLVGCQTTTQETPPTDSIPKEVINQEFDIYSLIGKSPLEIEQILGEPTSKYEPTQFQKETYDMETAVTYEKGIFELQMDYLDNKVTKMFLCVTSGTKDFNNFLIGGNLKTDATEYSLREVTALVDPSLYLCVGVIQK